MILELKKVFIITENDDSESFNIHILENETQKPVDITYGEPKTFLDPSGWNRAGLFKSNPVKLFPQNRINPILLSNITSDTLVILKVPRQYILTETSFSPENIEKDVLYSQKLDCLLYLFYGFNTNRFKIVPKIKKDKSLFITNLKNDFTSYISRKKILDLLKANKTVEVYNEEYDIIIKPLNKDIEVIFKGNIYLFSNSSSIKDMLCILKVRDNIPEEKMKEFSNKIRNKKDESINIIENWTRYLSRIKKKCREIEADNLDEENRLSMFFDKYIKVTSKTREVQCFIPKEIKIHFVEELI